MQILGLLGMYFDAAVVFASFLSGGFITAIVVNPPERKLAKRISVQWLASYFRDQGKSSMVFFSVVFSC